MLWRAGTKTRRGYRIFRVTAKDDRQIIIPRGTSLLYTFIGPPPSPDWTCHHMNVVGVTDRRHIRDDDLLNRIEWASPSTQVRDRAVPKNNASSTVIVATHQTSGERKCFVSVLEGAEYIGCYDTQIYQAIENNRFLLGWFCVSPLVHPRLGKSPFPIELWRMVHAFITW